jgi:dethiobiotin synthetase
LSIILKDLVKAVQPSSSDDFVVIEGAGGLYSPMAQQVLNSLINYYNF